MRKPRSKPAMQTSLEKRVASFTVHFIAAEEGGYTAEVPALPGCLTEGDSFEEAEHNAREAIQSYVASLLAHGESVPVEGETVFKRITVRVKASRV